MSEGVLNGNFFCSVRVVIFHERPVRSEQQVVLGSVEVVLARTTSLERPSQNDLHTNLCTHTQKLAPQFAIIVYYLCFTG